MNIMMLITGMTSGGAERVMATLCNELSKRHKINLVILKSNKSDYALSGNISISSGEIANQSLIRSVFFTKRKIEEIKPDIVLSFMTKSNIVALLANLLTLKKTKIIIAERANPYYAKKIFKIIRKILYPYADGCVFQTNQAKEYYKNILKCECAVLKNPLNPDFSIVPYEGERKHKIVTMGRLSQEKNQKLLIDAFCKITDKYPEYSVDIYGDGPLYDELDEYINELGLTEKVILKGRKNNIQEYIKDAEIFVLPSNSEGMPNALLEAMALGLACISTDCPIGGPAFIIQHKKNGFLVPMNDADKIAEYIEYLIENKKNAENVRENAKMVLEDFETKKVCHQWELYLKEIASVLV